MKIGDRVKIARGQPWAGECGEYVGDESTLVGILCKVELDNGRSVLQTMSHLIAAVDKGVRGLYLTHQ